MGNTKAAFKIKKVKFQRRNSAYVSILIKKYLSLNVQKINCRGEKTSFTNGRQVLFFDNVSFIAPGVPFTSTVITLLLRMIVLSLFYVD